MSTSTKQWRLLLSHPSWLTIVLHQSNYTVGRNLGWYSKAENTMHNYGMITQLIGGVPPIPRDSKNKEIFPMLDDI